MMGPDVLSFFCVLHSLSPVSRGPGTFLCKQCMYKVKVTCSIDTVKNIHTEEPESEGCPHDYVYILVSVSTDGVVCFSYELLSPLKVVRRLYSRDHPILCSEITSCCLHIVSF